MDYKHILLVYFMTTAFNNDINCRTFNNKEINADHQEYFFKPAVVEENYSNENQSTFSSISINDIFYESRQTFNSEILPIRRKRSISSSLPLKVDWRNKGVLTKIKDQKNCGACWAFSVLETVESMYAFKTGKLVDLSVQQLIDCSEDGDKCNGGDTCLTAKWLVQDKVKINPEIKYPTTLKTEDCLNEHPVEGVQVKKYQCKNHSQNETEILNIIANHGPVVVAVNSKAWHDYLGGIIQYHCDAKVDHAVQIVGYDLTGDVPYYIVRNSWGKDFGHDGFLFVKVGANVCGIAEEVLSLTV